MERSGQELIDFAKQAFQATLDAASKVQQQTHKLMEELIRQGGQLRGRGSASSQTGSSSPSDTWRSFRRWRQRGIENGKERSPSVSQPSRLPPSRRFKNSGSVLMSSPKGSKPSSAARPDRVRLERISPRSR